MTLENDRRANLKPAWSPDGLFIGFSKDQVDDDESFDLWHILAGGSGSAQVLEALIDTNTFDVDGKQATQPFGLHEGSRPCRGPSYRLARVLSRAAEHARACRGTTRSTQRP